MKTNKNIEETDYSIPYQIVSNNLNKQNTRWFIAWASTFGVLMIALMVSIGYIVYLLNDIEPYDAKIIDIDDVETIDDSTIKIGDEIWEKLPLQELEEQFENQN